MGITSSKAKERESNNKDERKDELSSNSKAIVKKGSKHSNVKIYDEPLSISDAENAINLRHQSQRLLKYISLSREIKAMADKSYRELKLKMAEIMGYRSSEMFISKILANILSGAEVLDKKKYIVFIELFYQSYLVISKLTELGKPRTPEFREDKASVILREIMTDFLYRFKDKHPFTKIGKDGDQKEVYETIMDFLIPFELKPSAALFKEYQQSETTKRLNILPSRDYLNSKFSNGYEIDEEDYNRLKERFSAKSPFVYFFNPSLKIEEWSCIANYLEIGFKEYESGRRIGAVLEVCSSGSTYQGYVRGSSDHYY